MGGKIKTGMVFLIVAMAFISQYVYAGILEDEKEELPEEFSGLKGYQVQYEEPDGKNGYYHKLPEIRILHQDEGFVTKYKFYYADGTIEEGELNLENKEKVWNIEEGDGIYKLETELIREDREDESETDESDPDGKEEEKPGKQEPDTSMNEESPEEPQNPEEDLESWKKVWEWKVDSIPPKIRIIKPVQTGTWYQTSVAVEMQCNDNFSKVASFEGSAGGNQHISDDKEHLNFQVREEASQGKGIVVIAEAEDFAGNKNAVSFEIRIDAQAPLLRIEGVEDYVISDQPVALKFQACEENLMQELTAYVERENPSGEQETFQVDNWNEEEEMEAELLCEQEGIYKIQMEAVDMAGNTNSMRKTFVIDSTPPKLPDLADIDGKCMKEFAWSFDEKSQILDFTTYTCKMELDGMLYHSGERILREGIHRFVIKAVDAAGNEAEECAEFEIDRTSPRIIIRNADTKEKIESGSQFDERIEIEIYPEQDRDWIKSVTINGKSQMLTSHKNVQLGLDAEKPYEIMIEAVDAAGNYIQRTVELEIMKQGNSFRDAVWPIKKALERNESEKEENEVGMQKNESTGIFAACFVMIGGILLLLFREKGDKK
ncbi:MAG: Ig-like domain repeat protein [Bariatricus sp.]